MRLGRISEKTVQTFQSLSRPLHFDDGLEVTELWVFLSFPSAWLRTDALVRFPTRNEVDSANQKRLNALSGKSIRYSAVDEGEEQIRDKLLANMMAPPALELKVGAQVMLIKNMDESLVNGSLGTVEDFMSETTFDLTGGMGRLGDDSDIDSDQKRRIKAFTNALSGSSKQDNDKIFPLVCFRTADGMKRKVLCVPEDWKVETAQGKTIASRKQIPLILAWALSIHKAQGQTLQRVKVDLGKVFEKGQAYVALSRATSQQGLQVLRFRKDKVMAHPRVIGFYNKLYSAESIQQKSATSSASTLANFVAAKARRVMDVDEDEEEALAAYG